MFKKALAILLAVIMLLTLAACGKEAAPKNEGTGWLTDGVVFKGTDKEEVVELGKPDVMLDPQAVYSKITYTPQMFYGDYQILGGDAGEQDFAAKSDFITWTRNGEEKEITTLPFRFRAGRNTMSHSVNFITEYSWAELSFMMRDNQGKYYLTTSLCAYEIEGNKITCKPLDTFNVDQETNKITYSFCDVTWEYTFSFNGRNLTFSSGNASVTMVTCLDAYGEKDYYYTDGYLSTGSQSLANIDSITFRNDGEDSYLGIDLVDGTTSYNSIAVLQENGLFTLTLALEESAKTYQCVMFYGGRDGFVLTDGTNTYYYNALYRDRYVESTSKYLTEEQIADLDGLTDSQLEAIAEKAANLLEDLAAAYQEAGLNVTVNTETGEIALDATVLFGVDESAISDEGKVFLQKFMQVYTSVVFDSKYEGFVSKIMVEGHTDTSGTYEHNMTLSEARANSVKEYCLSAECGVDATYAGSLQTMLASVGYSCDKPIYNESGEIDMDASRRVSFRFIINIEG